MFSFFTAFKQRKINAHVAAKIPPVLLHQSKANDQPVSLIMRFCLGRSVPKATTIVLMIPEQDRNCVITQFWRSNTDILLASPPVDFTDRQCQPKAEFLIRLRPRVMQNVFFPYCSALRSVLTITRHQRNKLR